MADIKLPEEIIEDFEQLSGSAIKVYILFRKIAGEIKEPKWIHCGYDFLMAETKLTSRSSIRKAMIELTSTGWIVGFRRGYLAGRKRVANQYLVSPYKNMENSMEVLIKMQDFDSKRNRAK